MGTPIILPPSTRCGWNVRCEAGPASWSKPKLKVQIVDDAELDKLTAKELLDLKDRIEIAIRAAIRSKLAAKQSPVPSTGDGAPSIDLERERDAWLSAKRT